jgi:hypothetical protein
LLTALAILALPGALVRVELVWVAAGALLAVAVINRALLDLFRRRGGLAFAAACFALYLLYYVCSLATYAAVWLDVRILHLRGHETSRVSPRATA